MFRLGRIVISSRQLSYGNSLLRSTARSTIALNLSPLQSSSFHARTLVGCDALLLILISVPKSMLVLWFSVYYLINFVRKMISYVLQHVLQHTIRCCVSQFFCRKETKVICSVIFIKACSIFFLTNSTWISITSKLEWLSLQRAFCVVLYCIVWFGSSQFSREKRHQWRQIAFNFFPQNPHNNGFHANNRAKLLSLFCTYRQIGTANCNIISISLRILGFIWLVFDQKFGMNELCTMFTNFLLRNQSINFVCIPCSSRSLTHR